VASRDSGAKYLKRGSFERNFEIALSTDADMKL